MSTYNTMGQRQIFRPMKEVTAIAREIMDSIEA
jgi:hypothetical protein